MASVTTSTAASEASERRIPSTDFSPDIQPEYVWSHVRCISNKPRRPAQTCLRFSGLDRPPFPPAHSQPWFANTPYAPPQSHSGAAFLPPLPPPPHLPPPFHYLRISSLHDRSPVPPKTSHSALPANPLTGFVGPSDWEHFSADHGYIEDAEAMQPRKGTTLSRQPTATLSPKSCTAVPNAPPAHPSEAAASPSNVSPTIRVAHAHEDTGMQSKYSPVSPGAGYAPRDPTRPVRVDSAKSEYSSIAGAETAEHIDGLIEAWNQPVLPETESMAQAPSPLQQKASPIETPKSGQDFTSHQKNMQLRIDTGGPSPTPGGANAHTGVPVTPAKPVDPCENLEPWSKSSLERFVAMLHKEQVADSDAER
ncbi:hypothetical protein P168DRAFT_322905 [Aspergillus campestris IBT 28561]|uniref:Uncharacterized protein n=1 Tax=Aspergillus campestris (strain IBT 28561) TaxID=1392248 RepID=A0A2I1CPZ8_ASPC2|nr:uncharacterized protein P168DRAFT_322905 [Aspergillus campestris IBT 28561]PKX99689.1 hypothetical protein P168DRAFT_322905 [Aspergillus campestris IBT 28561]